MSSKSDHWDRANAAETTRRSADATGSEPHQPPHSTSHPTTPLPSDPRDVDALLAESLRAQSEEDFTWKEPERRPRWFERAQMQEGTDGGAVSAYPRSSYPRQEQEPHGVRLGSMIFGGICLILAAWVLATVVFSLQIDPIAVALLVCTLAGLTLVAAGLRPKPGQRI